MDSKTSARRQAARKALKAFHDITALEPLQNETVRFWYEELCAAGFDVRWRNLADGSTALAICSNKEQPRRAVGLYFDENGIVCGARWAGSPEDILGEFSDSLRGYFGIAMRRIGEGVQEHFTQSEAIAMGEALTRIFQSEQGLASIPYRMRNPRP